MREGPSVTTESRRSCAGCVHHASRMVRGGRDPEYEHNCTHPDNGDGPISRDRSGYRGRYIGLTDETPLSWCPVLKTGRGTNQ